MFQQFFQAPQQRQPRAQPNYVDSLQALNAMNIDRYDMENGNKVLLPQSALQQLIHHRQNGPMIFKLTNTVNNRMIYVGVLEFIAEEGTCVVPSWLFESVDMFTGCQVMISFAPQLPKGKLIKLQPHETAFIDLPDPRAVLENQLRHHVCLTEGETITVNFSGRQYLIDIVEIKPTSQHNAVDINDADVEIDFAPPLDYEEAPPNLLKKTSVLKVEDQAQQQGNAFTVFSGKGQRLDGKVEQPNNRKASGDQQVQLAQKEQTYNPRLHKINHGVKTQIENQSFKGTSTKMSYSKPPL